MSPRSTYGRNASCCALLKRWISSMNRIVRLPMRRSRSASTITALISFMPLSTALNGMNSHLRDARDQLGERRLADAGRPPQDDRRQFVALDLPPQRLARPEHVLLPDVVLQALRPHALGERPLPVRPRLRLAAAGWCRTGSRFRPTSAAALHTAGCVAAIAAFSDSTPTVGIEMPRAPARNSALTPCASLPMTRPHGARQVDFRERARRRSATAA